MLLNGFFYFSLGMVVQSVKNNQMFGKMKFALKYENQNDLGGPFRVLQYPHFIDVTT